MATLEDILATPQTEEAPGPESLDWVQAGDPVDITPYLTSISFDDFNTTMKKVEEEMEQVVRANRKVVECYGCDEFAFDGSFTAFATDEGDQPFCPECVRAIEKRSAWQEETALPKGDLTTGWYKPSPLIGDYLYGISLPSHSNATSAIYSTANA